MAFRCSVRKYGIFLYHHGGDLLHALNVTRGQIRHQNHQSDHKREGNDPVVGENDCNFQQKLGEVCLTLNSKLHVCISKIQKEDSEEPVCIEDIDMNKFIENLDPDVWQAICLLTTTISKSYKDHISCSYNQALLLCLLADVCNKLSQYTSNADVYYRCY